MVDYFSKLVEEHAEKRPKSIAYIFMDQVITYEQFNEMIKRVANSMIDLGLRPGDKIATLLPQSPAFSTLFMAASTMGLVVLPLDLRDKPGEMKALCDRVQPKLLVGLANPVPFKEKTEELVNLYSFDHVFSYFGGLEYNGAKPYEALLEGSPDPVPNEYHPQPDDTLIIIFTSGTTGRPKGALISNKNTYAIAKATADMIGTTDKDRLIINMPTSHVAGDHDLIAMGLYAGASSVLCPTFDPQEALETYQKYKITITGGVPTMYRLMFKMCNVSDYDTSSITKFGYSGETQSPEFLQRTQEAFPNATIFASYGMSETSGFYTFTRRDDDFETLAATEGKPAPGFEMRAVRPDNIVCDPGEAGMLWVKSDSVINSYMDKEDNEGVFKDGWLRTGDLGFMDERGYLHYQGRSMDMYKSGGYNVYPVQVEDYLNAYPGVNTSAVISVKHELWGETGYAFIIPEAGVKLTVEEIKAYCKKGLADYKQPNKIYITNNIPVGKIGKVAKKELINNLEKYMKDSES
ncbi:MAG: class I adenylate-forming enzyme family protein [Bacillota bacterium]|nr:class I adenylate-forming enzyme family protein [Bacillota bacterium]